MKVPNPEVEVEKIMKIVDLNNSGVIDYMGIVVDFMNWTLSDLEFIMATINRKKILSRKNLEKAFKMFDKVKILIYILA